MFCPNCGQQLPNDTKFCINCGSAIQFTPTPPSATQSGNDQSVPYAIPIQKPSNMPNVPVNQQSPVQPVPRRRKRWYQRWWIWVILGFLSTAVFVNIMKDNTKSTSVKTSNHSSVPAVTQKETTVPRANSSAADEPEFYSVGDSYEAKGLKITVNSCDEYINDNEYYQPKSGNTYIKVNITIENNSNSDKSVGTGLFECYVDNAIIDHEWLVGDDDDLTIYDSISSGRAVTGALYYEVPKNANSIELEFSPSYWSSSKRVVYKLK